MCDTSQVILEANFGKQKEIPPKKNKGQKLSLGKWHFLENRMRGNLMDSLNQDKVLSAGLCNEAIILTFL